MQFRNMHTSSSSNGSFSAWLAQSQQAAQDPQDQEKSEGMLGQLGSIRDSFATQLEGLTGNLPEAGPLSAAFRERLTLAIYLLLAAVGFAALAFFVGLPTLMLRPSKFVLCLSLATLCAAGSVIVLQKPSVFIASLVSGGWANAMPVCVLIAAQLITIYVTVFVHRYTMVLLAAGLQVLSLAFYLASFLPGGIAGLQVLLRMMYALISTTMKPCLYVAKGVAVSCMKKICE